MSRGLIAGYTDYSHQSFNDMLSDLHKWVININDTISKLESDLKNISNSKYICKVDQNFIILIDKTVRFFKTSCEEISEVLDEIKLEVRSDHITRLNDLYKTAVQLNISFGKVWHQDYKNKEYGKEDFKIVENMYIMGRNMAADMLDISNLTTRLENFIGKKNILPKESIFLFEPNFYGIGLDLKLVYHKLMRLFKK